MIYSGEDHCLDRLEYCLDKLAYFCSPDEISLTLNINTKKQAYRIRLPFSRGKMNRKEYIRAELHQQLDNMLDNI